MNAQTYKRIADLAVAKQINKHNEENKREYDKAQKDLPKFLNASLKRIEKAAKQGKYFISYDGEGPWFVVWGKHAKQALKDKLSSFGFNTSWTDHVCNNAWCSVFNCGSQPLIIQWK